jgi:FG-GAP repeat
MSVNLFDVNYYRAVNPDLTVAGLRTNEQFTSHFENFGINEGRPFSPFVDLKFYGNNNPDLAAAGLTTNRQLFDHLQNFGIGEARRFSPAVDLRFYSSTNPDLVQRYEGNNERIFDHLQNFGINEGRILSLVFSPTFYSRLNPDLASLGLDNKQLLGHFTRMGLDQGRKASPFDVGYYLDTYPDLKAAGLNFRQAAVHFQFYGFGEKRSPFFGFSESGYLQANPDISGAVARGVFGSGYEHYFKIGYSENRTLRLFQNPTPSLDDRFGDSLATIGNNLVVGAPGDDTAGRNAGAAYLFNAVTGNLLRTFQKPTPVVGDNFGSEVVTFGNNILIAAPLDDTGATDAGAAYLFDSVTGTLLRTFQNPTPAAGDRFGSSLAVVGNNILIGAPLDDTGATDAGVAYLFDSVTGNLLRTFLRPNPGVGDNFGSSGAASGDNILIGAPGITLNPNSPGAGAAFLFDSVTGDLLKTFVRPYYQTASDNFGTAVGFVNNKVVVTSPSSSFGQGSGEAYLFDNITGTLLRTFRNPYSYYGGADRFGSSLATIGNNLLIGAPFASQERFRDDSLKPGATYLFNGLSGSSLGTFGTSGATGYDLVGSSLAPLGDRILIGAPGEQVGNLVGAGAVHLL